MDHSQSAVSRTSLSTACRMLGESVSRTNAFLSHWWSRWGLWSTGAIRRNGGAFGLDGRGLDNLFSQQDPDHTHGCLAGFIHRTFLEFIWQPWRLTFCRLCSTYALRFLQIDGVIGLHHAHRFSEEIPDHELSGWHCPAILQARYSREASRGTAQSIPDQKAAAGMLEICR